MGILVRYVALGLIAVFAMGNLQAAHAQVSPEQQNQYRKLVHQLIDYRKLSHCGLVSMFETERGLPQIDIKRVRESANVALMKTIDEYIKHYSPKSESQDTQARFRHDTYLEITSAAEAEVRKFVTSETKTNGCKEVLSKAGQHAN